MHNHLREEAKEKVLNQAKGESRLGPVVAPFEDLQHVTLELHLAVEVLLLEGLDGNELLAIVCVLVLGLVEFQVMFDGFARQLGLLILAGRKFGGEPPERTQNREGKNKTQEDPGFEAHAQAPGEVARDTYQQRDEEGVVERIAAGAFRGEGSIGDGRVLLYTKY
jgi:hypothetical protein